VIRSRPGRARARAWEYPSPNVHRLRCAIAILVTSAGCARDNATVAGDGGLDFVIGGVSFRVSSGGTSPLDDARALFLTDQPDGCLAVSQEPAGRMTIFRLRVAPRADGTTSARVVAGAAAPGPGQATGELTVRAAGVEEARLAAADGTVEWTLEDDGRATIVSLDVGFEGTPDRLRAADLILPRCP
jgi:hypothetical protein